MKELMPEHQIQSTYVQWVDLQQGKYPELKLILAVPNGSNKSPAARMKFKREGLRPGVPDICLPVARGDYIGLWLEFKSRRGVLSDAQKLWIARLQEAGHRVEVCRSVESAIEVTVEYLNA